MQTVYKRVILIDDDFISNFINEKSITGIYNRSSNIEIQKFTDAREGIAYIRTEYMQTQPKTLLLLDINMPVMSGWQFLNELNKIMEYIENVIDIYILSSSTDVNDKAKTINEPLVKSYLEKPLFNHLHRILDTAQNNVAISEL